MSQPPEDPHSAETQIGRPPPPPPPPFPPPPSQGWTPPPSQGWPQPAWQQPTWQPGPPQGPPPGFPPGPPQGPPPGWGAAPGGYGGPPRKRSKLPWIVAAVVLVLLLAGGGVTAVLLAGDDDGDDRASDPSTTEAEPEPATGSPSAPSAPSAPSPTTVVPDPSPSFDPDGAAFAVTGFWTGSYECAQGATQVDLTLAASGEGDGLDAVFNFGPSPESPDVPTGSFLMEGSISGGVLTLTGTTWLEEPPGYGLIDLRATVPDPGADTIEGVVTTSGCTSFEISR